MTTKLFPERVYHPYWDWEEINFNMWGRVDNREEFLKQAIEFTGDHKKYGHYMMEVVKNWTKSCEHNLSNRTQNRRAWVGHAACAMAFGCPEDIVREAWGKLTEEQRAAADEEAEKAIEYWEKMWLLRQNAADRARDRQCQKQD